MKNKKIIKIATQNIKLNSLLKFLGEASTGGQAKLLIEEENIKVNGEICKIRGKKIKNGDLVETKEIIYKIEAKQE